MTQRFDYLDWYRAGVEAWLLTLEASTVIGLRLARIAAGGSAGEREMTLMWQEKVQAAWELQLAAMTGRLGGDMLSGTRGTLRHYRRKVGANRRRLG